MSNRTITRKDLSGQKFGRYTVIEFFGHHSGNRSAIWTCLCECGTTKQVMSYTLTSGQSRSCGCLQREGVIERSTRHGKHKTPEYRVWNDMRARCSNPKIRNWHNYGGRGITVCERWRTSFENFLADMGVRPSDSHSLDRIDNDGNYEPGNCRWVTRTEQLSNVRKNVMLTLNGETKTAAEWARTLGINRKTVYWRLRQGQDAERVLGVERLP